MRFYKSNHKYYCGIDLHARRMYVCVLDADNNTVLHRNVDTKPELLLRMLEPFRDDVVIAVECIFSWYWIADLCESHGITFVLGHAHYMKAVHGGKTKNDRVDSLRIAELLRSGMLAQAYVYPRGMRSTRDLLRRRSYLVRERAALIVHSSLTNHQYNLAVQTKRLSYSSNREAFVEKFEDRSLRANVQLDMTLCDVIDEQLRRVECLLLQKAQLHAPGAFHVLRSVPGIGKILALVIIYEVHDIHRFPSVQDFVSYSRLVPPTRESDGKSTGSGKKKKIGNSHLKWAFSEASTLFLRHNDQGKAYYERLKKKHGKKAKAVLAARIGRMVYHLLKRERVFDPKRFFAS
jgi:transposase